MHRHNRHNSDDPVLEIASKAITWSLLSYRYGALLCHFSLSRHMKRYFCTMFGERDAQMIEDVPELLDSNVEGEFILFWVP